MAWTRVGFKGKNSIEPPSILSESTEGINAANIPIIDSAANRASYPGAFKFSELDDIYFHGIGGIGAFSSSGTFTSDSISRWFRDYGNTTT